MPKLDLFIGNRRSSYENKIVIVPGYNYDIRLEKKLFRSLGVKVTCQEAEENYSRERCTNHVAEDTVAANFSCLLPWMDETRHPELTMCLDREVVLQATDSFDEAIFNKTGE